MRLRAVTRIKNDRLLSALEERGWTQADLARAAGVDQRSISAMATLKLAKYRLHAGRPSVLKVAATLGLAPEDVAPAELCEREVQTEFTAVAEVDLALLASAQSERLLLPAPDHALEVHEDAEAAMRGLSSRQLTALEMRYGLHGKKEHTFEQIGRRLGCSVSRASQIVARAERAARKNLDP